MSTIPLLPNFELVERGTSEAIRRSFLQAGSEGRWRVCEGDDPMALEKVSLDIFWLRDDTRAHSEKLPPPDVIAREIVEDLEAALEQFRLVASDLASRRSTSRS